MAAITPSAIHTTVIAIRSPRFTRMLWYDSIHNGSLKLL